MTETERLRARVKELEAQVRDLEKRALPKLPKWWEWNALKLDSTACVPDKPCSVRVKATATNYHGIEIEVVNGFGKDVFSAARALAKNLAKESRKKHDCENDVELCDGCDCWKQTRASCS